MDTLKQGLKNFWDWSETNIQSYVQIGWVKDLEPFEYPSWSELIEETKLAILKLVNGISNSEIHNDILTVMALDNESEEILDYLTTLNIDLLKVVIEAGIEHQLYEARWQIAELLGRKEEEIWSPYLELLLKDSHYYVVRRTLISMNKVNPKRAEAIAAVELYSNDEYIRLVSLRILIERKSKFLEQALELLRNDSFEYIKQEIKKYENEQPPSRAD